VSTEGKPDRQISPDAEGGRMFLVGCGVIFVAFLLLSAAVYLFWIR
jgi:hypothetical protein